MGRPTRIIRETQGEIPISIASMLRCAFSLDAQISTTLNRLPNGWDEVRIRNNCPTSLVAFVYLQAGAVDRLLYSCAARRILRSFNRPGSMAAACTASEERIVMRRRTVPGVGPVLEEPIVIAGILARRHYEW
jgi:hypothetical protein